MTAADAATQAARRQRMRITPSLPTSPPPCSEHGSRCYRLVAWVEDAHGQDWHPLNHPDLDVWAQRIAIEERKDRLGYDKGSSGAHSAGLVCSGPSAAVANLVGALKRAWQDFEAETKAIKHEPETPEERETHIRWLAQLARDVAEQREQREREADERARREKPGGG